MISNFDTEGILATKHIKLSYFLGSVVPIGMVAAQMIHPGLLLPYYFYYKKAYDHVLAFAKDPSH